MVATRWLPYRGDRDGRTDPRESVRVAFEARVARVA